MCVCMRVLGGVYGGKKGKKRNSEGEEDEKTRGASFDAVNVQIYVEGQWSTFIRSAFLPVSLPPASSHPISFYPSTITLPSQAFSLLPLPPILSYPVTHHYSSLLSPVFPCLSSVFPDSPPFLLPSPMKGLRLLWTVAIRPTGGIGRPQKRTGHSTEGERER